jgi:hypothetical protein
MVLVGFLSDEGWLILLAVAAGSFAASFAMSSLRVSPLVLFVAAPVAAIGYLLHRQSRARLHLRVLDGSRVALMLTIGTVAWWLGLTARLLKRRLQS